MHSRAYLLIKRDLYLLENNPVAGVDIESVVDNNYFDLTVLLRPPKTSIWSGCLFRVFCSFYDTYNIQPPILQFDPAHIPYHPNVDPITGRVSLSTSENWNPNLTLRALFEELISVFIQPNEKTVINTDALRMLKHRANDYQNLIDESIEKSRQSTGLTREGKPSPAQTQMTVLNSKDVNRARQPTSEIGVRRQQSTVNRNQHISFEDYLNTWKGIATSKANLHEENPLLRHLSSQPKLQAQHLALNANELAQQLDDRALQFERLKYGNLPIHERSQQTMPISQLSVPSVDQQAHVVTQANSSLDVVASLEKPSDNQIINEEIDELIEWTQGLPATAEETIEEY